MFILITEYNNTKTKNMSIELKKKVQFIAQNEYDMIRFPVLINL